MPVFNHSVMGMTAEEGLSAFLKSPPAPHTLCVIEYGGNDCDLDWAYVAEHPDEATQAKVPLSAFRQALQSWVDAARERDMLPFLVTPPPLHAERYFHWVTKNLNEQAVLHALHGDIHSIYRWQERYTLVMRDIATKTRCALWDLRDLFLAQADYSAFMCVDGIHPNEAGYRLITENVPQNAI